MNKTELVNALAMRASIGRPEATRVVDALFDASTGLIAQALRTGNKVQLSGFGTFEARKRKGRIPQPLRHHHDCRCHHTALLHRQRRAPAGDHGFNATATSELLYE